MVSRSEVLQRPKGKIYVQYDKELNKATTSSFVTTLTIDSEAVRESVFVIHNNAAGDLDYEILGNADDIRTIVAPTGTDDDDDGWVVIGSGSIATTIAPAVETLSNPYTQVVVRIKHTTATTNTDVWHRGEN